MKKYKCSQCGGEFSKNQMDSESLVYGESFCKDCASSLIEAGRDFEDPDHDEDWDKN
jgi:DNA-directed RNA polymerase subunit RPC12/RpoP